MDRWNDGNKRNEIDRGAPASVVISRWGSLYRFCEESKRHGEAIGKPGGFARGTVHRWIVNGSIDAKYHSVILALAKLCKAQLKPLDFVDTRNPADLAG